MEGYCLDVVEQPQQVSLDGVGVTGLTQDLKETSVGNKEESRENKPLLLQISTEGLLAEFKLLQKMRK